MNHLKNLIQSEYSHLTDTNKLIADTILKYGDKDFNYNLVTLAKKSYCSNSAITKFINYFGYTSYKIFVNDLNVKSNSQFDSLVKSFDLVEKYKKRPRNLRDTLLKELKKSKKVYLFASGQSKLAAIDFSLKGNKKEPGKYIFQSNSASQEVLIHTIADDDLVIFISNSGESRELIKFLQSIISKKIFLITNRDNSTLTNAIENVINLDNNIESQYTFKEFSKESKYTLLYFFDDLFEELYRK